MLPCKNFFEPNCTIPDDRPICFETCKFFQSEDNLPKEWTDEIKNMPKYEEYKKFIEISITNIQGNGTLIIS
jgi:hypothetical protein